MLFAMDGLSVLVISKTGVTGCQKSSSKVVYVPRLGTLYA